MTGFSLLLSLSHILSLTLEKFHILFDLLIINNVHGTIVNDSTCGGAACLSNYLSVFA